uniref:Uncharacterized protein n=1 Tax=Panagrolaimus superbus TaxID=310955 RepID=A0A914XWL1_9BILA
MKALKLKVCLLPLAFFVIITNAKLHGTWAKIFPKPTSSNLTMINQKVDESKHNPSVSPIRSTILDENELKEMFQRMRDPSTFDDKNDMAQNEESQLKDVMALTNAIKTMLKVLKHTHFLDHEIKEILETSKTFGLLFKGGSSLKELEKTPEMKAFKDVKEKLLAELSQDAFKFLNVPDNEELFVSENIIFPIKALQSQIHQVIQNFTHKNLVQLQSTCQHSNPLKIAKGAEKQLNILIAKFVDQKTPENDEFMDLKNVYTVAFERLFAFSSICNTFLNESVTSGIGKNINDTKLFVFVDKIRSTFEDTYWSAKRIMNEIKTQINIGGTNAEIAFNIYDELTDEYKDFGYTYHVGTAFVLRNAIKKGGKKEYRACEFLASLRNDQKSKEWCNNHTEKHGDLRDLADEIIEKCKIPAFLISVGRADYQSEYDKRTETFFDHLFNFPCYGNVHIAAVNNQLP